MPIDALPTEPYAVAPDTFLIPALAHDPGLGAYLGAHSLVIRGTEPVVVDTGVSQLAGDWLAKVGSVVDLDDVRWVFVSHDDHDHIGGLELLLEAAPQATLVGNFAMTARLGGSVDLPIERMRWLDPGDSFVAGDRTLSLVRPLFDSPATRGLFDHRSGVLWAVDTFGSLFPGPVYEGDDIPADLYDESFFVLNTWNTPWVEWLDADRFAAHVRATSSLPIEAVASAHGPVLRGARIADGFERTVALATQRPAPMPGQADLEAMLAALAAA
jgi:flavorubredoxin